MFKIGQAVHSKDPRDDGDIFYVILEYVPQVAGKDAYKIGEAGREEHFLYRRPRMLFDAEPEIKYLVHEANRLAREAYENREPSDASHYNR